MEKLPNIRKYKRREVSCKKPSIDFDKVYAPVARLETIKIIVSTTTYRGWKIHKLDVKLAFLNGPVEEEVYVIQPP